MRIKELVRQFNATGDGFAAYLGPDLTVGGQTMVQGAALIGYRECLETDMPCDNPKCKRTIRKGDSFVGIHLPVHGEANEYEEEVWACICSTICYTKDVDPQAN